MTGIADSFSRPINYLRISVTDRCNLRCRYCLPEEGIPLLPRQQILSFEELAAVAAAAAELGINRVRLTGGEPLARAGLVKLVEMLSRIRAIDDLSLTSNGVLLARYAGMLKKAGLSRVNVSLDSLRKDRFQYITRRDRLDDVLSGIEAARAAELAPVKINMVVLRGLNDDEVVDFAHRTITDGWHVRFIELMPFSHGVSDMSRFVSAPEIREKLVEVFGEMDTCSPPRGNGPARYFRFPGARGTVGFITPVSQHFCYQCNRLRLTASGKLRTCLLADDEIDLSAALRQGDSPEQVKEIIRVALKAKPQAHHLAEGAFPTQGVMTRIGG